MKYSLIIKAAKSQHAMEYGLQQLGYEIDVTGAHDKYDEVYATVECPVELLQRWYTHPLYSAVAGPPTDFSGPFPYGTLLHFQTVEPTPCECNGGPPCDCPDCDHPDCGYKDDENVDYMKGMTEDEYADWQKSWRNR